MSKARAGFTLLEVITAVAMLAIASIVALKASVQTSHAVAVGRRWTAMAHAVDAELGRIERAYRIGRPNCLVPAPGSDYTPDGVGLAWSVRGDSVLVELIIEARARAGGRVLIDTARASLSCR
ncbi:MAG: prepilin-type N-terminal cleavage/methylation domain-containing protein [Gemmatimonadales bacterium]